MWCVPNNAMWCSCIAVICSKKPEEPFCNGEMKDEVHSSNRKTEKEKKNERPGGKSKDPIIPTIINGRQGPKSNDLTYLSMELNYSSYVASLN